METEARRRQVLETLRKEREHARAAAASGPSGASVPTVGGAEDAATAQRREDRNALVQRLLSERGGGGKLFVGV